MAKSKFFRIAVEGATTDGRVIERSWLLDMAATYNPATYTARVFNEHIRGFDPAGPFKAYGDVVALKAEAITDGDLKGKMALYAQIEPTPELVAMVKAKQKIFSSMEVAPNFATSNRAYLQGLGVTDSPASLGTEVLSFAAQNPEANPFASRKQSPDNLFSAGELAVIEFEEEPSEVPASTIFAAIKAKLATLSGKFKTHDANTAEIGEALNSMAEALAQFATRDTAVTQQFADQFAALSARLDATEAANAKHATDFAALHAQLEATPNTLPRQPASGGNGAQQTNC